MAGITVVVNSLGIFFTPSKSNQAHGRLASGPRLLCVRIMAEEGSCAQDAHTRPGGVRSVRSSELPGSRQPTGSVCPPTL